MAIAVDFSKIAISSELFYAINIPKVNVFNYP